MSKWQRYTWEEFVAKFGNKKNVQRENKKSFRGLRSPQGGYKGGGGKTEGTPTNSNGSNPRKHRNRRIRRYIQNSKS